jgi:hypothetical protein
MSFPLAFTTLSMPPAPTCEPFGPLRTPDTPATFSTSAMLSSLS